MLYAGDLLLYRPVSDPEDFHILQSDLESLEIWSENQYLQLNPVKCKYTILSRRRVSTTVTSPLHLCGSLLDRVETSEYLGVLITSNLHWSDHIDNICHKARKVLGFLCRQFYKDSSSDSLQQLYLSLV